MAFKVNDVVTFNGYEKLLEGQDPLFREGDLCRIVEIKPNGSLIVTLVDDADVTDNVFPEEIRQHE
jgi:hypothetical protein